MPSEQASSMFSALGLTTADEQLYYRLDPVTGHTVESVAALLGISPQDLVGEATPLVELGLVVVEGERLVVPPLPGVVARLVRREAGLAGTAARRLEALAEAVPHLVASATRLDETELTTARPLDGELSVGGDPLELLRDLLRTSRGDMLWLRPDAWAMPRESRVAELVGEALATGRRSRAIYPVRAVSEAHAVLVARARMGEQVRVISELPTRMFILGDAHAVLPEPLGFADEPRVHVRQRSVVAALIHWFDSLWLRAEPVPGLESGLQARPDLRRFLLEQLMAGSSDEVIARKLGISLRTVRRRIAQIMVDLGVDTRFQAGVEAARRGWL